MAWLGWHCKHDRRVGLQVASRALPEDPFFRMRPHRPGKRKGRMLQQGKRAPAVQQRKGGGVAPRKLSPSEQAARALGNPVRDPPASPCRPSPPSCWYAARLA